MNYQVLNLIQPYVSQNNLIFYALVCNDWHQVINKKDYKTPYHTLTSVALLSYSHEHLKMVINETVKGIIIKLGSIESLTYLHTKTDLIKKRYMDYAVVKGSLATMKWLKANGCKFNDLTFAIAATNGNLDTMKWLLENGCEFTDYTFSRATSNGNLENMKWLRDNGCPQ